MLKMSWNDNKQETVSEVTLWFPDQLLTNSAFTWAVGNFDWAQDDQVIIEISINY